MKKILLFSIILYAMTVSAYAQVGLGIKPGLNISDCAGSGCDVGAESLPKAGINVGVSCNYGISRWLMLQAEMQYSSLGIRAEDFTVLVGGDPYIIDKAILYNKYLNFP